MASLPPRRSARSAALLTKSRFLKYPKESGVSRSSSMAVGGESWSDSPRRGQVLGDCALARNLTRYDRLLRGSAAAKSLSRCSRLRHRCGIRHSNLFGGFPRLGVTKLDIPF